MNDAMTDKQKETIKVLYNTEFRASWGFGGAMVCDLPDDTDESISDNDVMFRLYTYGNCFDCECGDCDDSSECDTEEEYWIAADGTIDGLSVDEWIDSVG